MEPGSQKSKSSNSIQLTNLTFEQTSECLNNTLEGSDEAKPDLEHQVRVM
jgi:hypothetical protein